MDLGAIEPVISLAASTLGVLHPALNIVKQMADTYTRVKFARARCKAVVRRAALIVKGVNDSAKKTGVDIPSANVKELEMKLEEVQKIIHKLAEMSFLKALLRFDTINLEIELADRHLSDCLQIFQIELLFRARVDKEDAVKSDKAALHDILKRLTGNYEEIRDRFGIRTDEEEDQAMAAMERKLSQIDSSLQEEVETRIIKSGLDCIRSSTGKSSPKLNKWLITELDLDFGGTIGGGGFSTVRKARFRGTTVAVKTLKDVGNMKALEKEIDIWSRLRHDHIVPFYGASTLSNPPYIVSRYMKNGNLIQYLARRLGANRTKLIHEISLGMLYLHSEQIVHGDLKGVNVLVDDSGKACITDFGLSSFSSTLTAEAAAGKISGTLRFLAPEALRGQPLNFATDTYAFGMVIYEVFAGEGPFVGVPDDQVKSGNLTLTRPPPSRESARDLTDTIWQLLLECSARDPSHRPPFVAIQKRLEPLVKEAPSYQSQSADQRRDLTSGQLHYQTTTRFSVAANETNWTYDLPTNTTHTVHNNAAPSLKKNLSAEKPTLTSTSTIAPDVDNMRPVCVEVTCTHKNVEFGLMKSREPGVYLEETDGLQWQPVSAKKGSLMREAANYFTYRRSIGDGSNTWELEGTNVRLHSSSINAVCAFRSAQTARNWFALQLSYARNGYVGLWGATKETGDWITMTRSWRRVVGGTLQHAAPLEEAPNLTVKESRIMMLHGWMLIKKQLPAIIVEQSGPTEALHDRRFTTGYEFDYVYREPRELTYCTDPLPILEREEMYASETDAHVMFDVMKAILGKGLEKKQNSKRLLKFF